MSIVQDRTISQPPAGEGFRDDRTFPTLDIRACVEQLVVMLREKADAQVAEHLHEAFPSLKAWARGEDDEILGIPVIILPAYERLCELIGADPAQAIVASLARAELKERGVVLCERCHISVHPTYGRVAQHQGQPPLCEACDQPQRIPATFGHPSRRQLTWSDQREAVQR